MSDGNEILSDRLFVLCDGRRTIVRYLFLRGGIMPNPLYRAERCRDPAEECRAIAALSAPSSKKRTHYCRMSGYCSLLAEAEELAELAGAR
jgi:hypothetical protein